MVGAAANAGGGAVPGSTSGTTSGADAGARLLNRLAIGLVLDLIAITRGEGNVLDTLLTGATIQANVQEIIRRADLQLAYSGEDDLPPDELRRPVSMNALATSLGLPFETVRRRIRKLVKDGYCAFVGGGVIVPSAVLNAPQYYVDGFRAYERLRSFYYQARDQDLLPPLPEPTVDLAGGTFPVRAVARLMGVYVLRAAEVIPPLGDLLDGMIWMETYRANVEHLPAQTQDAGGSAADDIAGDAARRPQAVTAIAARLGVPQETVRRHVTDLVARGQLARVKGGLIVPAAALARPELAAVLSANSANMQRLFAGLAQLGVLAAWDALQPPAPAPLTAIPQNG